MDLARLTIVGTFTEAELICALLGTAGISAMRRQTDVGAGAWDGFPHAGAQEVLVAQSDLGRAREVLAARPTPS